MRQRQAGPLWGAFLIMLMDRFSERALLVCLSEWRWSTLHTRESDLEPILRERKLKQEISVWNNNLPLIPKQPGMGAQELMRPLTPCARDTRDFSQCSSIFPGGLSTGYEGADRTNATFESKAVLIRERLPLRRRLTTCQVVRMIFIRHLETPQQRELSE